MKGSWTTRILRILLGLVFVVFGLNFFLQFLPMPPLPGPAGAFIGALVGSGYMMTMVAVTQIVAGALLLIGVIVPFALVILAPVIVNIVLFHVFLAPAGIPLALIVSALELGLVWQYRQAFAPLFQ